jgi:hypothetical protein
MRLLACVLCLSLPLAAATIDDVKREAALVRELASKTKLEGFARTVPLTNLKRALRDWIEANLGDGSEAQVKRLNELIEQAELGEPKCTQEDDCMYANRNGFLGPVRFLSPAPGFLVAETKLGMLCGYDASHYLYRRNGERWVRLIAAEQTDYSESAFQPIYPHNVVLSTAGPSGERLFAIVGENPWCTSCWNRIYIRVWRIEGERVTQVLNRRRSAYRCNGEPTAEIGPNHIRVEHLTGSFDAGAHSRKDIQAYQFAGNALKRVPPIAANARDFTDEWLTNPWADMRGWSAPELSEAHRALHGLNYVAADLRRVSRCPSGEWQISVRLEKPTPAEHHFLVSERSPLHFRMERVSPTPTQGCTPVRE